MIRRTLRTGLFLLWLPAALCACSSQSTPPHDSGVAVGTVMPVRQTFHDHVEAWGTLAAAPHTTRSMTLPYGAQIVSVNVIEGQAVKRGDDLLTVRPDPAARRAYAQAVHARTLAHKKLDETRQLVKQHLATRSQLDTAQNALADARTTLQSVQAQGGGQAKTTLKAPADGVVGNLTIHAGQQVSAGTPLLVFLPTHAMVASLAVLPEDAAQLHAGQSVRLHAVYDVDATWSGKLATIGHAVNPQTHLVPVVATLDGHSGLAAGAALAASIHTSAFTAWAVPRSALQSDAHGDYVLQIEHGKAKRVNVKVLAADGSPNGVAGKLDPRAPIITLGSYEVAVGDPVHAATPRAATPAHGSAKR